MSSPISSTRQFEQSSVSSTSESLVESSTDETGSTSEKSKLATDEQSKSAPLMKSKTKKSAQREAYSSSKLSTSDHVGKDMRAAFSKQIVTTRQSYAHKKESLDKFIKKILILKET